MKYYISICHNNRCKVSNYYKQIVGDVAKCLLPNGKEIPLVVGELYRVYFYRSSTHNDLVAFYPHVEGEDDEEPNRDSSWYMGDEYLDYLYSEISLKREEQIDKIIDKEYNEIR